MSRTDKSDFYRSAAIHIASQKVALAKAIAEQRHAPPARWRKRDIDTALLRRLLKKSERLLTQLATANDSNWHKLRDKLIGHLNQFHVAAELSCPDFQADGTITNVAASNGDRDLHNSIS